MSHSRIGIKAAMNFIGNETSQKLRGGYYTPEDIASFITAWVAEVNPMRILEPSCGDGVFIRALNRSSEGKKGLNPSLFALEFDTAKRRKPGRPQPER